MEQKKNNPEFDQLIRSSMQITDTPSLELNNRLKASLYQHETALGQQVPTSSISLWYLPMILNFITFMLLAGLALLTISNPYLSVFTAGICLYTSIAGIFITMVGVKRTNIKEAFTLRIEKRGVIA